jgi:hypothetical protein
MIGRSAMQPDIFDLALRAVSRQLDLLGVENNRVFDFAVIRQAHINALIAHPVFRLADKKPRPSFWQANRHGGICAGRSQYCLVTRYKNSFHAAS